MDTQKLHMVMLGCTPKGRFTEQHDIFFGIGNSLKELIPDMISFWPEAEGKIHIDAWQEITHCDGYKIEVIPKEQSILQDDQLFFLNLGGYKENEFEEYHYKIVTVAKNKAEAIKKAKATTFYKHSGFKGATSHIDDKYGIDVDEIYKIEDILNETFKSRFQLKIRKTTSLLKNVKHIGYLKLDKIK